MPSAGRNQPARRPGGPVVVAGRSGDRSGRPAGTLLPRPGHPGQGRQRTQRNARRGRSDDRDAQKDDGGRPGQPVRRGRSPRLTRPGPVSIMALGSCGPETAEPKGDPSWRRQFPARPRQRSNTAS
jgi:hypothetical protein